MSLQVWLPLQGDLHNQGLLSNFPQGSYQSATNVFSQCGKIGGTCLSYSENLTTYFKDDSNNNMISLFEEGNQYSISCWIKLKGIGTSATLIQLGYNDATTYPTEGNGRTFGFWWTNTTSGYGPRFVINNGDGGNAGSALTAIATDYENWHHFVYSLDNGSASTICKIYIDGELVSTKTVSRRTADNAINTTNSNNLLCLRPYCAMYNDFRIYDHILSSKEVEEIAKGLVLHYKLDNNGMGGENLFSLDTVATNASSKTIVTVNNNIINVKSSGVSYGAFTQQPDNRITFESGITYTLSGHIKSITKGEDNYSPILTIRNSSNNNIQKQLTVSGNESDVQGTYTPSSTFEGYISGLVSYSSGSTNTIVAEAEFSNIKLEKGIKKTSWSPALTDSIYPADFKTTIYDSSGYSNNGIIVGSLTAAAPSPRYDVATVFATSSSDYFYFPHLVDNTAMNNEFTFSCWLYRDYTDATARALYYGLCYIYLHTDFRPRILWQHASADLSYNSENIWTPEAAPVIAAQTWTHLAWTFNNGVLHCYINGQKVATDDRSGNGTFIRGTKGSPNASVGYNWIGRLSDVRTYATALSDAQVKELYNTSMSIDSNGNVYARELVEL